MSSNPSVHILIADHHAIFRAALRKLLESEPAFHIVGEAADGPEAMQLTPQLRPHVLLLDLDLPHLLGVEALRRLNSPTACWRIILLVAHSENAALVGASQLGARGIIMKNSSVKLLFEGIRAVVAGKYWLGTKGVVDSAEFFRAPRGAGSSQSTPTFGLTPRELQVVCAVLAGCSNRDIAERFSISRNTTKHHLSSIFDKLGVSNRLELALFACHHRITDHLSGGIGKPASASHIQSRSSSLPAGQPQGVPAQRKPCVDALEHGPTWRRAG